MFAENTVIILGAGASAEFGLPTGGGLFQRLLKEEPYSPGHDFANSGELRSYSMPSAIMKTFNSYSDGMFNNIDLIKKAKSTFEGSIDLFSYNNKSVIDAAKFFTCWHIGAEMIEEKVYAGRYYDSYKMWEYKNHWFLPYINGNRNYIAEVAKKLVENSDGYSDISENLCVISFNYDMIFEKALKKFLLSSERYADITNLYMPEVLYTYGKIPFYENVMPNIIAKEFENIKFMMEIDKSDDSIQYIRDKIIGAEYIYLLGFSLDPVNVDLIGLSESRANKFSTCYDGNLETISRLQRLGVDVQKDCLLGSESVPISLSKAASLGLFSKHEF